MKKLLLILILLSTLLHAKDDTYIGLGPYFQTQPYKDADPVVLASPVIFFDNSLFYVRWTRVGMYFYGQKGEKLHATQHTIVPWFMRYTVGHA